MQLDHKLNIFLILIESRMYTPCTAVKSTVQKIFVSTVKNPKAHLSRPQRFCSPPPSCNLRNILEVFQMAGRYLLAA